MKRDKAFKPSEVQLAKVALAFFEAKGWDPYPETVIPNFPGRPDSIMVKQQLCAAVEVKQTLSYPVLEQLTRWRHELLAAQRCQYRDEERYGMPHLLYAVTARVRGQRHSQLKREILERHRLGHIEIQYEGPTYRGYMSNFTLSDEGEVDGHIWCVHEAIAPRIQPGSRRTAHRIIEHLKPDMKIGIAGSTGVQGAYMTPFRRTMALAVKILETRGEIHVAHLVQEMNRQGGHHYTNDSVAQKQISKFLVELNLADKPDHWRPVFRPATS